LLRDRKIYCGFADDLKNDMWISVEIPKRYKNWEVLEIESIKGRKLN